MLRKLWHNSAQHSGGYFPPIVVQGTLPRALGLAKLVIWYASLLTLTTFAHNTVESPNSKFCTLYQHQFVLCIPTFIQHQCWLVLKMLNSRIPYFRRKKTQSWWGRAGSSTSCPGRSSPGREFPRSPHLGTRAAASCGTRRRMRKLRSIFKNKFFYNWKEKWVSWPWKCQQTVIVSWFKF